MKKLILLLFLNIIFASNLFAQDWATAIKVKARHLDSTVIFGENASATNGFDPAFDVPFFGGGTLSAYFVGDGGNLFKDLRPLGADSTWTLRIEVKDPSITTVELFWQANTIPFDYDVSLFDPIENATIDMKNVRNYRFQNTGVRYLDIVAKRKN